MRFEGTTSAGVSWLLPDKHIGLLPDYRRYYDNSTEFEEAEAGFVI